MKKSLVLAMTLAMGVSATALAANPFSDLPAGHWAYASVAKLAAAGIVDGYPDGTFKGERTMTRYEMAQIVAKALAKGAIGADDKLVGEFADELDNLGVRVAKLEKHADNFRITAQVRYSYQDITGSSHDSASWADAHTINHNLRTRLFFTGDVNDNWQYVGMLQNNHSFSNDMSVGGHNQETTAGEGTNFQRAYLQGRLGGARVQAGRIDFSLVDGNLYDNRFDGVKAEYGSKVRIGGYYGRPTDIGDISWFNYDKFWGINAAADAGNFNFTAGYDKFYAAQADYGQEAKADGIWNVGAKYNFNDKASLGAIYMKSNLDEPANNTTKGYVITGTILGAKPAKVGSWGLWTKYYNQGYGTVIAHVMNGVYGSGGFNGWGAGVNYTVAKNMVAGFEYYDLASKGVDRSYKTLWSELTMMF